MQTDQIRRVLDQFAYSCCYLAYSRLQNKAITLTCEDNALAHIQMVSNGYVFEFYVVLSSSIFLRAFVSFSHVARNCLDIIGRLVSMLPSFVKHEVLSVQGYSQGAESVFLLSILALSYGRVIRKIQKQEYNGIHL